MAKKYMVIVVGDENDADYVEQSSYISESDLDVLKKIIEVLKKHSTGYSYPWPDGEYANGTPERLYGDELTEDDFDFMRGLCPHGEHGINSIESIKLIIVEDEIKLL